MKLTDILTEAVKAGTPTKVVKPTTSVEPIKTAKVFEPKKLEKPKKAAHLKSKEDTRKTSPSDKLPAKKKEKVEEAGERPYWGSYYDVHSEKPYWMDTDDKNLQKEAGEGTSASDQAHHLGLTHAGYGYWKDASGKTVAKTVQDKLTKLEPGEMKVKHPQEHPAINPDAKPEPGEPKEWEKKTPAQRTKYISGPDKEVGGMKSMSKHPQEYPAITPTMNAQGKEMPRDYANDVWGQEEPMPMKSLVPKDFGMASSTPEEPKKPIVGPALDWPGKEKYDATYNRLTSMLPGDISTSDMSDEVESGMGLEDGMGFAEDEEEMYREHGDRENADYWKSVRGELEDKYNEKYGKKDMGLASMVPDFDEPSDEEQGISDFEAGKSHYGPEDFGMASKTFKHEPTDEEEPEHEPEDWTDRRRDAVKARREKELKARRQDMGMASARPNTPEKEAELEKSFEEPKVVKQDKFKTPKHEDIAMSEIKLSDFIPEGVKDECMEEAAPLGSGARFKKVEKAAKAGGAKNPAAVAAAAGRKKYGQKKMTALAQKGKRAAK